MSEIIIAFRNFRESVQSRISYGVEINFGESLKLDSGRCHDLTDEMDE